jgi:hypothetical protein
MPNLRIVINWLKGHDSYELRDGVIHRWRAPFREETLPVSEIESWTSYPEMAFDVVEIRRRGNRPLIWFDHRNDLTAILEAIHAERLPGARSEL